MRKGERFRRLRVPIVRRTRAPTPSDCSIALTILVTVRVVNGEDMFDCVVFLVCRCSVSAMMRAMKVYFVMVENMNWIDGGANL